MNSSWQGPNWKSHRSDEDNFWSLIIFTKQNYLIYTCIQALYCHWYWIDFQRILTIMKLNIPEQWCSWWNDWSILVVNMVTHHDHDVAHDSTPSLIMCWRPGWVKALLQWSCKSTTRMHHNSYIYTQNNITICIIALPLLGCYRLIISNGTCTVTKIITMVIAILESIASNLTCPKYSGAGLLCIA